MAFSAFARILVLLGVAAGPTTAAASATPDTHRWGMFSSSAENLIGGAFEVEIRLAPRPGPLATRLIELVETRHLRDRPQPPQGHATHAVTQWADTRDCPAIRDRLRALRSLEAPVIEPPDSPRQGNVIVDGSDNRLEVPAVYASSNGRVTITLAGDDDTPLARWIADTMAAVKPCWRDHE